MWRWQGVVAVILALGITGTLLTITITGAVNPSRMTPITAEESSALTTVLGAVIGALAVFLGVRNGHRPDLPPPRADRDRAEASLDAAVAAERARVEAAPEARADYAHIARTDETTERLAGPEDNPAGLP